MSEDKKGMLAAGVAYSIFGLSYLFSKMALNITEPMILLVARFSVTIIVLNLLVVFRVLKLNFKGKNLEFTSSYPGAKRLELGGGNKPPLRFIKPAVIETANELSELIISEAISSYQNNSRFGIGVSKTISTPQIQSNYLNKYSKMLK